MYTTRSWQRRPMSLLLALLVLGSAPSTAAPASAAGMTIHHHRVVGVTLLAELGERRMLNACDEETIDVLASRGPGGVEGLFIRSVTDTCTLDEAEEYISDMTNVTLNVAGNLGRATLIADVVVDDGRRLHINETFTATGPATVALPYQQRLRDPETGSVFLFHNVVKQRFVESTGTFGSDWGYLLRANEGTLSACKSDC